MRSIVSHLYKPHSLRSANKTLRHRLYSTHFKSLEIKWSHGETMKFNKKWLRSCCPCHDCHAEHSNQKLFLTSHIKDDLNVEDFRVEDDQAIIRWNDGHKSIFSYDWLSNYTESKLENEWKQITPDYWDRDTLTKKGGIPTLKFKEYMEDEKSLYHMLKALNEVGVVVLKDSSTEDLTVLKCAERISYIRETMYGRHFDVMSKPSSNNIAYTSRELPLHQDLCYYESPPGIQYLHCIRFDQKEGGDNLFADGFHLAQQLKKVDPQAYKTLSTLKTTFHKYGDDHSMIFRRPIIDVNENDDPIGLYWSPPFEGPMMYSGDSLEEYYRAYKSFKKITDAEENHVANRLEVGDIVVFNNRRVFHARTAYDENQGIRHLQGTYTEADEMLNRYRVLARKYGNKEEKTKIIGIRSY